LDKRTATLRTLLKQGVDESKLLKAADRVRVAQIQVLRATIGAMPTVLRPIAPSKRIVKLLAQIESLRAATPRALLAEFQIPLQANSV